jgi:hypothetical protein
MPNDADYLGVRGSVALVRLEKYGNLSYEVADNSSLDLKFFHIFCSDCQPVLPKNYRLANAQSSSVVYTYVMLWQEIKLLSTLLSLLNKN